MNSIKNTNVDADRKQWICIYRLGGIFTILVLVGIILDIAAGNISGGNLADLPQTAVDRFAQLQDSWALGLYNLDLLNTIVQILMIPVYFALYGVHRKTNAPFALLSLIIFVFGTAIFVAGNTALPMYELSKKYAAAPESDKVLFAAAGEALLAKGSHGSLGVFFSFLLPNIAGVLMSLAMLTGKVFSKTVSWIGFAGSVLMVVYIILVTFIPSVKTMATAFAMPGGLLLLVWMVMFGIKLFKVQA